jgi:hypothetical protein
MRKSIFFVSVVAFLTHLTLSVISLALSSFPNDGASAHAWSAARKVLMFPLVYLDQLNYNGIAIGWLSFDWIYLLVLLNSALWAVAICLLAKRVMY